MVVKISCNLVIRVKDFRVAILEVDWLVFLGVNLFDYFDIAVVMFVCV